MYANRCKKSGDLPLQEHQWVNYQGLLRSQYYRWIQEWVKIFPAEKLKLVFFDRFVANPEEVVNALCKWVGIDPVGDDSTINYFHENKTRGYRNAILHKIALSFFYNTEQTWRIFPGAKDSIRKIYYLLNGRKLQGEYSVETRQFLEEYFKEHNKQLHQYCTRNGLNFIPTWLRDKIRIHTD